MWLKAKEFKDDEIANKILKAKSPKEAKALGRKVKNYNDKIWSQVRFDYMVEVNLCKYSQSEDLKSKILDKSLRDKGFVEASPLDGIWGIKLAEMDDRADDESKWLGTNLLGKALDKVRAILLEGNE